MIEHRIPWSDVDLAKIVYFPKYFSYFEMAELEWFRTRGLGYEQLLHDMKIWLPRVAAQANFKAPAHLNDLISIEMGLKRMGEKSYTFGYDAYRLPERTHLADGKITVATVSREEFLPIAVPERLSELLEELATSSTERATGEARRRSGGTGS